MGLRRGGAEHTSEFRALEKAGPEFVRSLCLRLAPCILVYGCLSRPVKAALALEELMDIVNVK